MYSDIKEMLIKYTDLTDEEKRRVIGMCAAHNDAIRVYLEMNKNNIPGPVREALEDRIILLRTYRQQCINSNRQAP